MIFVYDMTDMDSFDEIEDWLEKFQDENTKPNVIKILAGNKNDLLSDR